jgi:lysophospholipase L1-like esterase
MALTQLIDRAHAHGIKVIGATLTPYVGAKYQSPEGEKVREAENDFILHSGKFDGVVDFAKATADPTDPTRFAATAGSADNLHPGDSGYQAMGDSIDLKLFKK